MKKALRWWKKRRELIEEHDVREDGASTECDAIALSCSSQISDGRNLPDSRKGPCPVGGPGWWYRTKEARRAIGLDMWEGA